MRSHLFVRGYKSITFKGLYDQVAAPPKSVLDVNGWIKSIRLMKNVAFMDLQDGTTSNLLKVVVPIGRNDGQDSASFLKKLKTGQSISIKSALWQNTPERKQPFELKVENPLETISIVGEVSETYPLQKKYQSLPFLRTLPTLKHRTTYLGSLLRFRSEFEYSLTNFFRSQAFIKVSPPVLTSGDCEGAGELFKVESNSFLGKGDKSSYFGKPTYLTVSTQLHLEILALALSRCWSLSPCFRAEESDTNRHLSEFWMLETELCYTKNVHELTELVKNMLRAGIKSSFTHFSELIPETVPENSTPKEQLLQRWNMLLDGNSWKTITYTKAIELLEERHGKVPFSHYKPRWGEALQTEHEKWLAGEYFKSPVFVTDYPKECKAFYMKVNSDNKTVACFDLLVPEMGEIVGGSLREDNFELLQQEMQARGMNKNGDLDWYVSLRKDGTVPHGGFGMGLERILSYLYGNSNIRDAIPFHRAASGTIDL